MKKLIMAALCLFSVGTIYAQDQYQVQTEESGIKIFKGLISRAVIENEPSFTWYAANKKVYTPNAVALAGLRDHRDSLQFIVFMGTWCEDSYFIIPKFFSLLDAAGVSSDRVSLIGTDRNKKTLDHLSEALQVVSVPTIIVMKNGKELGRVVEYGKTGEFDKDLAAIVK